MKRVLFFAALCCAMLFQTLNAQDIIVTKQSTRIDAKVLEISDTEVRYKKVSNIEGPTFVMATSDILAIIFDNGEVQIMSHPKEESSDDDKFSKDNWSVKLCRVGGVIVSSESVTREADGLKELLGMDYYSAYRSAKKSYRFGGFLVMLGLVDIMAGVSLAVYGMEVNNNRIRELGYFFLIASDVCFPIGFITKGIAAGRISRIAEGYNATHNKGTELSLSMSPTLMNNHGQIAPGVGLTLRF